MTRFTGIADTRFNGSRSQRQRGLRRRRAAARLLGLRVGIPPGAWMTVCCECCVLLGRGLCDGLILRGVLLSVCVCVCVWCDVWVCVVYVWCVCVVCVRVVCVCVWFDVWVCVTVCVVCVV